ncbi:MAG: transposase [Christensenellales bacterium]
MRHSTTDTYQLKREVLTFSARMSTDAPRDWQKFTADMVYGALATGSCILSRFADALKENIHKKNTVEQLARKLTGDMPPQIKANYLSFVREMADTTGPVFVDDTDIIKPYGKAFENMWRVRDGSSLNGAIAQGYHVTEITALSRNTRHPVSLYSHIHSAREENYTSVNDITFRALEGTFGHFPQATYVFDRNCDMNNLFTFMHKHDKQFIVRITEKRKLFFKGKWLKSATLRDSYKGKFKRSVHFNGKDTECWVTCVNARATESKRWLKLVLVYGLTTTPMMLLTNRAVNSKADALRVVRMYFMRWRIEKYFRFKKQRLGFENLRVRSLKAMNNLNRFLSMATGFLCVQAEKRRTSKLRSAVMREANGQRNEHDIAFLLYRIGLGVIRILGRANTGIRKWFHIGRPKYRQLSFPLLC